MKGMVLEAPSRLEREEVPRPAAGAGEILIRVTHSGVCGTDLKIFKGAIPVRYPRIMGHEMIGEIAEDPGGAFRFGERVIVDPQLFCGNCFHCKSGQTHLCPNGKLLGRDINGGFAEYVTVPAHHVHRLPDGVRSQAAPLIQVLTTCLHSASLINIAQGESAVIMGLGVTGQLHLQLAKARGASPIIGITRSAAKRELAQQLGADLTLPGGEEAIRKVLDATGGRGADVVIETTGMVPVLADAIRLTRSAGRILLFGIMTATEGALPFYDLYYKELTLIGARVAKSEDYPASIDLVNRGIVRLEPLISDMLPLEKLGTAMEMLGSDSGPRMKIIMEHN
jgi:2-desacetyl-2-hydroxyethyl bacteriochlorophyllide A dehydrogenase